MLFFVVFFGVLVVFFSVGFFSGWVVVVVFFFGGGVVVFFFSWLFLGGAKIYKHIFFSQCFWLVVVVALIFFGVSLFLEDVEWCPGN